MFAIVERRDDGRQIAVRVNMIEFITRHTDADGVDYFSIWLTGYDEYIDVTFMSGQQIYSPLGNMESTQDEEITDEESESEAT
jgi:hypothetical protein